MSAPVLLGCAAATLCLAIPVVVSTAQVAAGHQASALADSAALAAADALSGFANADPCSLAREVVSASGGELVQCDADPTQYEARVVVSVAAVIGAVQGRAHAGGGEPLNVGAGSGVIGANGWAWPSDTRAVTQGFHDGYSIDLAVTNAGALYAPFDGIVMSAGPDGGGVPAPCLAHPEWWHGQNYTVLMKHEVRGQTLYSSHNHVATGSAAQFGIHEGTTVRAGQRVATAGLSGCTSGAHTHFTLATSATNSHPDVNPYLYIGAP